MRESALRGNAGDAKTSQDGRASAREGLQYRSLRKEVGRPTRYVSLESNADVSADHEEDGFTRQMGQQSPELLQERQALSPAA